MEENKEKLKKSQIVDNLSVLKDRISAIAREAGRPSGDVELMAVTKFQTAEKVGVAIEAGHRLFGENRVQEAAQKYPALKKEYPSLRLHLIGPLQTNKVRQAV